MAGSITEVADNSFPVEILESETAVLVDVWAPRCGPCHVVEVVLEKINGEREDLRVVKPNVDDNQQTTAQFEALSVPALILFTAGQPVKKVVGPYRKKRPETELELALAA